MKIQVVLIIRFCFSKKGIFDQLSNDQISFEIFYGMSVPIFRILNKRENRLIIEQNNLEPFRKINTLWMKHSHSWIATSVMWMKQTLVFSSTFKSDVERLAWMACLEIFWNRCSMYNLPFSLWNEVIP